VKERRARRRRKLLNDLKERRRYSHLKEEALDLTMWRARFGRSFGPVVTNELNLNFRLKLIRCLSTCLTAAKKTCPCK